MGGCASKPSVLKEEMEAPLPLQDPTTASLEVVAKDEPAPMEDNHRHSLGVLLQEEEAKEAEVPKTEEPLAKVAAIEKIETRVVESSNVEVEKAADDKVPQVPAVAVVEIA